MLLNHLASVTAMVQPPPARAVLVEQICAQFSGLVSQHVRALNTTPGGVLLPGAADA